MEEITRYALIDSIGTALYVIGVASFMYLGSLGAFGNKSSIFVPIVMLMLFVFSAAFTGSLVFGRPVIWYLEGKKEQALSLVVYTLGLFLAFTLIALFSLIIINIG